MYYKKALLLIILIYPLYSLANTTIYYCPSPQNFKTTIKGLTAETNFHNFKYSWVAKDQIPTQFSEYPLTFKGADIVNCKDKICDIECFYYSNIEAHLITATMKSTQNLHIYQEQNSYLKNFNCQYTEHVDCPFIINYH
ncbi:MULTISPECIES: hypothetical protein [unclassified Francisella]|uniref:hypothetical protein n=1 Tax=unclassified Francisella TaxID=2610885 RepID=UPI002E35A4BB|nr:MULTISPECIES: hypothetical protein [unclassified Francisella]MED7819221.1 hypothetical protein [Francisella sp. 19S2-4]MED7830010.1 hypothetical protein [Francisella sp. 19S2-10]